MTKSTKRAVILAVALLVGLAFQGAALAFGLCAVACYLASKKHYSWHIFSFIVMIGATVLAIHLLPRHLDADDPSPLMLIVTWLIWAFCFRQPITVYYDEESPGVWILENQTTGYAARVEGDRETVLTNRTMSRVFGPYYFSYRVHHHKNLANELDNPDLQVPSWICPSIGPAMKAA